MKSKEKLKTFYDFSAIKMNGQEVSMADYAGKVVLVVNTASKCGFTPQFEGLEKLYETYKADGLEILGFPCNQFAHQDSGSNEEIEEFCKLNYGVSFTMFQKIMVNGSQTHPLYRYLKKAAVGGLSPAIKWNFTKFLINHEGKVIARYAPTTKPEELTEEIERLLKLKKHAFDTK